MSPRAGLDILENRKISGLYRDSNPALPIKPLGSLVIFIFLIQLVHRSVSHSICRLLHVLCFNAVVDFDLPLPGAAQVECNRLVNVVRVAVSSVVKYEFPLCAKWRYGVTLKTVIPLQKTRTCFRALIFPPQLAHFPIT